MKHEFPHLPAFGLGSGQVGDVLDHHEAGRADHRAVPAGKAALGDLVPARVLAVGGEQLGDRRCRAAVPSTLPFARHRALGSTRSPRWSPRPGIIASSPRRDPFRSPRRSSACRPRAPPSARCRTERRPRAGAHRDAKHVDAATPRLTATTKPAAPTLVLRVDETPAEKAWSSLAIACRSHERTPMNAIGSGSSVSSTSSSSASPFRLARKSVTDGGCGSRFRLWPDGVAEAHRRRGGEAVCPRVLLVGPAGE